jgi:hypothetical protein
MEVLKINAIIWRCSCIERSVGKDQMHPGYRTDNMVVVHYSRDSMAVKHPKRMQATYPQSIPG